MTNSKHDLVTSVPQQVVESQKPASGQALLYEKDGLLHATNLADNLFLAGRASRRVRAECEWFEKIISHGPSVGSFYEGLLSSTISELLPAKYKVGEGFVYDTHRQTHSKQIDMIVYEDAVVAPLYRRDGFVVAPSSTVRAVAEVKKTLKSKHLRELIEATFTKNLGTNGPIAGLQYLPIFAFDAKESTEAHFNTIKVALVAALKPFVSTTKDGSKVTFGMRHLVLPRVYYLNRNEWICANLQRQESGSWKIELMIADTLDQNDGLSLFLDDMIPAESLSEEKNFLSHQFMGPPIKTHRIEQDIEIFRELSMQAIIELLPHEIPRLRALRVKGKRPYAANLSARVDLTSISSLEMLTTSHGFQWWLWDETTNELNASDSKP